MRNSQPAKVSVKATRSVRMRPLAAAIVQVLAAGALVVDARPATAAAPLPLPQPEAVLATMGVASYSVNGTRGIIEQKTDRAILNWKSFDIGRDNSVEFRQPAATSIALNRINERVNPSQILGTLTANGQVYLYNPNGIVFGKGARIDVNSLVASTLNITDAVFQQGITNAIGSGAPAFVGNGEIYLRNEDGSFQLDGNGARIKIAVRVDSGAVLNTNAGNGRILLLAPSVVNAGEINAPEGQVILAAATDKVYLQAADSAATGIRGLLVEVSTGGDVTNIGKIAANKGNVTLAGFAVNQRGVVSATTSVDLNGSILLKAAEQAAIDTDETGAKHLYAQSTARTQAGDDGLGTTARVTLGEGSVTEVLPELGDASTAVDEQKQDPSRIDILGKFVQLQSGARVKAPGGKVAVVATENPANPAATNAFSAGTGIELAAGSSIDVAGSSASASVARNVVEVQLLSNELRDAPDQKGGPLFGKKILVDIRTGTPLADVSGGVARVERDVAERTANGGSITLQSGGTIDVKKNSVLDVSGGLLNYLAGYVQTTKLLGADGKIYDISEADPQRQYLGVLGEVSKKYEKWNITKTWSLSPLFAKGRYEQGYVEGKAGGQLNISGPSISLQGELRGNTFDGVNQRTAATRAAGASLSIDQSTFVTAQNIVIANQDTATLLAGLNSTLALADAQLAKSGFRQITLQTNRNKSVDIAADATVTLTRGGALTIKGGSSHIDGAIDIVGGRVDIATANGDLSLAQGAAIDVRGEWVNDNLRQSTTPVYSDGGSVALNAGGWLALGEGSRIDVSGGAWLQSSGKLVDGKGGSISLRADAASPVPIELRGTLTGAALKSGGTLSITANRVELIPTATAAGNAAQSPYPAALLLAPEFFRSGGFRNYAITADRDGLLVRDGAIIQPLATNLVLSNGYRIAGSARGLDSLATTALLPAAERNAANLALAVQHTAVDADPDAVLRTGSNSHIVTDVGGSVKLTSDSDLLIAGSITAPAGTIDLKVTSPPKKNLVDIDIDDVGYRANQGIWLDSGAALSATGVALYQPSALGIKAGEIRDGGSVRLTADRGYIVLASGSRIDVSGAAGVYSQASLGAHGIGTVYTDVVRGSDGGSIQLTAADGALLNGVMSAHAGAAQGAGGGTLALTLTTQGRNDSLRPYPVAPSVIRIGATTVGGTPPVFGGDLPFAGYGVAGLSAAQIEAGGFAALDLGVDGVAGNAIRFDGPVQLAVDKRITLDTPAVEINSSAATSLQAAYVALGSIKTRSAAQPSGGAGSLTVRADLIDLVGGIGISGINRLDLLSDGDIRLRGNSQISSSDLIGQLLTSADIRLHADQIYPTTFSQYEISLLGNPHGTITIEPNKAPHAVLSAAGKLTLNAPNIRQSGVLKAPFGALELNATEELTLSRDSITSVSAEGWTIPFGKTLAGLQWIYDLVVGTSGGNQPIQTTAPEKRIALNGKAVHFEQGATLDVSGGGDLQAYEFIRGPGGSADVLDPSDSAYGAANPYTEKYALLPALQGEFAPYDYSEFSKSGLSVGDSVYLSASSGLPGGVYVLLPARYALLPGAFLLTPQAVQSSAIPATGSRTLNGAAVVSGYRLSASTHIHDSSWSSFVVEPGSVATTRSQYALSLASGFFAAKASAAQTGALNLPADAGAVAIAAQTELTLRGTIRGAASGAGRRAQLDILADAIDIVAQRGAAGQVANHVELLDSDLNGLEVGSIFIGGTRSRGAASTTLNVGARSVEVFSGAALTAPELLLAATGRVAVDAGATLAAQGAAPASDRLLTVQGDAALLRVSSAAQARIDHVGAAAGNAQLTVARGATLRSAGSVNIDSTGAGAFAGTLDMRGGALEIGAQRIALGAAGSAATGIVLDSALLNSLQVDQLALHSRSQIDLFGPLDLRLKELEVNAAGFNGGAGTSTIRADRITLANPDAVSGTFNTTADSRLRIDSGELVLGAGDFALGGFSDSDLAAQRGMRLTGKGRLLSASATTLRAPSIASAAGADYAIAAQRGGDYFAVNVLPLAATGAVSGSELGGRLRIDGSSIGIGGADDRRAIAIVLPSGQVELNAHGGDVNLAAGATIDVAGRQQLFADKLVFSSGGSVSANASGGNVIAAEGSRIDVSAAADGGDAGTLTLTAPDGRVQLDGQLAARAQSGYAGGSSGLDVGSLGARTLAQLNDLLRAAGFDQAISLRRRSGDWVVDSATSLRAQAIKLIADLGAIRVDGSVDASGSGAGSVTLAGGRGVTVTSGAKILARATADNEKGGKVLIDSVGGTGTGGGIDLQAGSLIDVRGGAVVEKTETTATGSLIYNIDGPRVSEAGRTYRGGEIVLRAPRTADSLQADINGSWRGAEQITAEAVRVYDLGPSGTIDDGKIGGYKIDTANFMSHARALGSGVALTPGIEVRAANSLTLSGVWDLADWRYGAGNGVGTLTLRSGGKLAIEANLTDAFKAQVLRLPSGTSNPVELTLSNALQEGQSWSYRLIGGGDLGSADVMATVRGSAGNITLGAIPLDSALPKTAAFVRTGTGSIDVAAAGNLTLVDDRSALYTAGRKLPASNVLDRDNPYGTQGLLLSLFYAEYPVDGGDITIDVGGDVVGATESSNVYRPVGGTRDLTGITHQFITDWWIKAGSGLDYTGWGIALDVPNELLTRASTLGGAKIQEIVNARSGFRQNVGALGGGDVDIKAGGNLVNLSVVIPTTGKPVGARTFDPVTGASTVAARDVLVNGGGRLRATAGGDIAGGLFFIGAGSADIRAGGNIRGGSQYTAGPVFALGNTALKVSAMGDLDIGAIFDPGLLTPSYSARAETYFLTYGDRSAVDLTSVSGDIVLHNDIDLLANQAKRYTAKASDRIFNTPTTSYLKYTDFLSLYPARLTAQALSGDIDVQRRFTLLPGATGTLNLLAANTIQSSGPDVFINLSDAAIDKFPGMLKPSGNLLALTGLLAIKDPAGLSHAAAPVHALDIEPARVIALNGDILANLGLSLGLSKPALIAAGRDIVDIDFDLQNIRAGDVTTIQAGRDIRYGIEFNTITGALQSSGKSVLLSGPGRFDFIAGADIDLGASNGIVSVGNLRNSALATTGASLGIYAGVDAADYAGFEKAYLESGDDRYTEQLLRYVAAIAGLRTESKAEALAAFKALSSAQQRKLLVDIFFGELRAAGIASAESGDRGLLQRGLDAIKAFFPADDHRGDLKLFLSTIKTVAGGDIDILVPGGSTNAGLAASGLKIPSSLDAKKPKQPSELGIVAQSAGDVNIFVRAGLQVNQSRVFALGGGDITVWSTDGDIDAGRGSKAALSAPPPTISFDDKGNLRVDYPPSVSGSGIRTAAPPKQRRGDVYLFTVNGSINVGEAGISGEDLFIVGPVINPGGGLDFASAVGAPTATVSVAPGLAALGNQEVGATQAVTDKRTQQPTNSSAAGAGLLTAQLVGFGDYSIGAIRSGDFPGGVGGETTPSMPTEPSTVDDDRNSPSSQSKRKRGDK